MSPRCKSDPPLPLFLGQLILLDFSAFSVLGQAQSTRPAPPRLLPGRPGAACWKKAVLNPKPPGRQLTAQQDGVGVLLAGHPAQRVAQRPPAAGAQKHQRPVFLLSWLRRLLVLRPFRAGHGRVPAQGGTHARPLLQQLVAA